MDKDQGIKIDSRTVVTADLQGVQLVKPAAQWNRLATTSPATVTKLKAVANDFSSSTGMVLFSGERGSGKTLAAEVIANDLGRELLVIDLSSVVSKYIGETEKNLSRVFEAAEHSNAILFFDEADALFGKRTEVKDSHDRYANLEIAYLLQRIEEYSGLAIVATNKRHVDDAEIRQRAKHIVDFAGGRAGSICR